MTGGGKIVSQLQVETLGIMSNAEKNGKETPTYNLVDHLLIFTHFFGCDQPDSTLV